MTTGLTLGSIELAPPAMVAIVRQDKSDAVLVDVYACRRVLESAAKQAKGDEEAYHAAILDWLAQQMHVERSTLAENNAVDFQNHVCAIIDRLNEERKKKVSSTVASLASTQESPAIT